MNEVAPELAGGMVQTIGPVFKQLAEHLTESDLCSFARIAREQEEFLAAWREWCEVYGLHRDSWILEHTVALLPAFLNDPDIPPSFAGAPVLGAYLIPSRQITPPGLYYPVLETRAEYDKRVSEYGDLVEKVARATGWEPAPAKPQAQRHLRWLARFQVKGETVAATVGSERESATDLDQRTVERALKEMAGLIGLTRRTLTRPQGSWSR